MSELAQKIGHVQNGKSEQAGKVSAKGADNSPKPKTSREKQAVRDITKEQWFWDTAVLS